MGGEQTESEGGGRHLKESKERDRHLANTKQIEKEERT